MTATVRLALIVAATLAAALAAGFLVWWLFVRPGQKAEQAAIAKVEARAATVQVAQGRDALATVERVRETHDRIERITHENTTRILAAPGADAALAPGLDAALLGALCLRDVYRADPACQRLPGAAAAERDRADAGRADPD